MTVERNEFEKAAMITAENELFEVAVIGGGIHGAGVAQAAAAAGYRTLLIEREQWASATSRASSKLIHGGLRYLESAQFSLVYHSLRERQRLFRNAPTLVEPVPFYIPIYKQTRRRPWQIRIGLSLYALLTGFARHARFRSVPRHEWGALGGLLQNDLQAVFQYWDGQTDDAALTRAVVASAEHLGARCIEHCQFVGAKKSDAGFTLQLQSSGKMWNCSAITIVNATGPWVNDTLQRCSPAPEPRTISLVKGSHIVLPHSHLGGIFYLEAPRDGRVIFAMPWQGKTLIGTTETEVQHADSTPSDHEVSYLLETVHRYFPHLAHTSLDVLDRFAGVRVLPTGTERAFNRARESVIEPFDTGNARIVTIYGGKLTTYRHTAELTLAQLQTALPKRKPIADIKKIHLS